jgi:hypothetical protein
MYILVSEYVYGFDEETQTETSINLETSKDVLEAMRIHKIHIYENFNIDEDQIGHRLFKQVELEFSLELVIKD